MINSGIKNNTPNAQIRNSVTNTHISAFQTTRSGDGMIAQGTPIGLLLVLTYTENVNLPFYGDFRPNVSIR